MGWWKKKSPRTVGAVLFRGTIPPRAEEFAFLLDLGIKASEAPAAEPMRWSLSLEHPSWGKASLSCFRDAPLPSALLIDHDPRLVDADRELMKLAGSTVTVSLQAESDNVLRDRKNLLRFLRAVMGDDGVGAVDVTAQSLWARATLDEELGHDAELDILALFTMHLIHHEGTTCWMHSHGLKELGFFDFDVIDPSPELWEHPSGWDLVRATAFAIVEGKAALDGGAIELVGGAPGVRFLRSTAFRDEASNKHPAWAQMVDQEHLDGHGVACDVAKRGFLGLFTSGPRPSVLFQSRVGDDMPLRFSDQATDLMAARARATWQMFRELKKEFAELELPSLVKLRYAPSSDPSAGEHLWFEVQECREDGVEATLLNDPWSDLGLQKGDRRVHGLERLTDWTILTPAGAITPRSLIAARKVREHLPELCEAMRKANG